MQFLLMPLKMLSYAYLAGHLVVSTSLAGQSEAYYQARLHTRQQFSDGNN